jgi:hypothetical protein
MAEPTVHRPRWRDALVLTVLAVVLMGGLVHYGRGLDDPGDPGETGPGQVQAESTSPSPSAEATAQLDSGPPSSSSSPPPAPNGTCWDGRETTSLRLCGLPDGARGLAWVFPSFDRDRTQCHQAQQNPANWAVVESYECFQRVQGQPVTVTYDQVDDPTTVEHWLLVRIGAEHMRAIPGPNGGRFIVKDGHTRPVRITGLYRRFPYVVSVYADSPQTASRAWKVLVRQRAEQEIRGVRAG